MFSARCSRESSKLSPTSLSLGRGGHWPAARLHLHISLIASQCLHHCPWCRGIPAHLPACHPHVTCCVSPQLGAARGYLAAGVPPHVAVWLCGSVAVWLCGCVAVCSMWSLWCTPMQLLQLHIRFVQEGTHARYTDTFLKLIESAVLLLDQGLRREVAYWRGMLVLCAMPELCIIHMLMCSCVSRFVSYICSCVSTCTKVSHADSLHPWVASQVPLLPPRPVAAGNMASSATYMPTRWTEAPVRLSGTLVMCPPPQYRPPSHTPHDLHAASGVPTHPHRPLVSVAALCGSTARRIAVAAMLP